MCGGLPYGDHEAMVRTSFTRRLAAVTTVAFTTVVVSLVSATPAQAASVQLLCESHLDNYVCGVLQVTGFDNVPTIGWSINGQTSQQWVNQWNIYRRCASRGHPERVTVVARGLVNGQVVTKFDTWTIACNCLPGN
jgi:hypothetical protein